MAFAGLALGSNQDKREGGRIALSLFGPLKTLKKSQPVYWDNKLKFFYHLIKKFSWLFYL